MDKVVIQKREVHESFKDYYFVLILIVVFIGLILAMIGPRTLFTIRDALFAN